MSCLAPECRETLEDAHSPHLSGYHVLNVHTLYRFKTKQDLIIATTLGLCISHRSITVAYIHDPSNQSFM
jgi:hypothetical protein